MPKSTCSVPDCERPSRARKMCWAHYQQWRRTGSTEGRRLAPEVRFWSKVDKSGSCWTWMGALNHMGYGSFTEIGRKPTGAHRYSYELENGPIANGIDIDHICHNPACVRPSHLRAATRKQNAEHRKGAQANSKTGVRGVYFESHRQKYLGIVGHNGKRHYAGSFDTIEEAGEAVTALRLALFTHNYRDRVKVG